MLGKVAGDHPQVVHARTFPMEGVGRECDLPPDVVVAVPGSSGRIDQIQRVAHPCHRSTLPPIQVLTQHVGGGHLFCPPLSTGSGRQAVCHSHLSGVEISVREMGACMVIPEPVGRQRSPAKHGRQHQLVDPSRGGRPYRCTRLQPPRQDA